MRHNLTSVRLILPETRRAHHGTPRVVVASLVRNKTRVLRPGFV